MNIKSTVDYDDCPEILSQFLFYISTIRNLSQNTVNGYYIDLRTFFRFLKQKKGCADNVEFDEIKIKDVGIEFVKKITTGDVYEYLNFVKSDRENNASSRARKVACLRTYFKYLTLKVNLLDNDPVKDIDVPALKKSLPRFLTLEDSRKLLANVPAGEYYERDFCIVTLFLNCGMRLAELCSMDVGDLRDDQTVRIVGKGNKERIVFLNTACVAALRAYLPWRAQKTAQSIEKALFISRLCTRISPRRVEQIVDECLARAGLADQGYSAHKLRHTAATLMYRYGSADMLALKEILGHEHVSTTEIYTHISDEQLKKAATSSPLADVKPQRKKKVSDD